MASVLNTDLGDLYDQWNQRVAFNEGYEKQKIVEARQFGANAYSLGLDRKAARDMFFERRANLEAEAREFLSVESVSIDGDFKEVAVERQSDGRFVDADGEYVKDAAGNDYVEPVEPDQVGEVTDGEETLGMESVVANETEDVSPEAYWANHGSPEAYWADVLANGSGDPHGWNFPEMSAEDEAHWARVSSEYTLRGLDDDFGEYGAMSADRAF